MKPNSMRWTAGAIFGLCLLSLSACGHGELRAPCSHPYGHGLANTVPCDRPAAIERPDWAAAPR